jgi:hypothetical protein
MHVGPRVVALPALCLSLQCVSQVLALSGHPDEVSTYLSAFGVKRT